MRPDFHIAIIGGGIVGACAAALAATNSELAGLRIALIDSQPASIPPPEDEIDLRVSAVSRASERILSSFDAWASISDKHLGAYDEMVVWDATGKPRGRASIHFSAGDSSEPNLGYIVENRRVLWAIYASRVFRDRVTVLQGALSNLSFAPDNVEVTLADGRRYTTQLAIGSDGADSASRALAGIETVARDYSQAAFVTHVSTQRPHQRTAWQRFLPGGPLAYLPLADGRSSIVWTTTPEHAQRLVAAEASEVDAQLSAGIDHVLGEVTLAGPRASFPLRLMHARSYCRERFVLIGDAAHTVHPLAGQGVNLGLLDAAALMETLAAGIESNRSDVGELRSLRRYERWRKSENTLALGFIDALHGLFGSTKSVPGVVRRWGLESVDDMPLLKGFFMSRAMGIGGELPKVARATRY